MISLSKTTTRQLVVSLVFLFAIQSFYGKKLIEVIKESNFSIGKTIQVKSLILNENRNLSKLVVKL